ncbi:MAG: outer membrane lipoprotein carrier protein LolA [Gemmatimonadales bacterium]
MRKAALASLLLSSMLGAQDATSVLRKAERSYRAIETLEADFVQTIVNPMLGGPETTHGTFLLAPPNRFAMRFDEPAGDRIVADGKWLWAYAPSSVPNQVIRQPIPKRGAATPNLLAQFVDRPLEHYRASYVGSDTVSGNLVDVVHLVPRTEAIPFRSADISISRSSGMVMRLHLREPSGQQRTLTFERIRTGMPIPASELRFDVPKGTRIVTPN